MRLSFPTHFLQFINCPEDGGRLTSKHLTMSITTGKATCESCGAQYSIEEGILRMPRNTDEVSSHEQKVRDSGAEEYDAHFTAERNESEIRGTLDGLQLENKTVVDLGCGTGRVTATFLGGAAAVLGIDFSLESLKIFAKRAASSDNLGLVWTDASCCHLAKRTFDVALSTQVLEHISVVERRSAFVEKISTCLKPGCTLVLTAYHYSLLHRYRGEQPDGVHHNGIFYHCFTRTELKKLLQPWFYVEEVRPIQVPSFYARKFHISPVRITRLLERVPGINLTGHLLRATGRTRTECNS